MKVQYRVPEELKSAYPFARHGLMLKNNLHLNYVDEGKGEPIVMVHGNPTWSFFYRELIKEFSRDHRVVVPDHIGCGLSDKPEDYDYLLENHIQNIGTLIAKLQLKDITLVVHDWGGAIGLGYATRYPENIKRIVILNTAAFTDTHIPARINLIRNAVGEELIRRFNAFAWPATFMAVKRRLPSVVKKGYLFPYDNYQNRIATAKFVQDIPMNEAHPSWKTLKAIEEKLPQLKVPVLILWGAKDFCFTTHFFKRWKKIYPQAKDVLFKDAGHYVLEDARDEVIREMKEFLQ